MLGPGGGLSDIGYAGMLPAPYISTITPSASGGTLSAGTYYYEITALDSSGGETAIGPENNATTTGNSGSIAISATSEMGYQTLCYRIYKGTSSGMETGYLNVTTIDGVNCTMAAGQATASYTDTNSVSITIVTPPTLTKAYWLKTSWDGTQPIIFGIDSDTGASASFPQKPIGHGTSCGSSFSNCVSNHIGFDEEDGLFKAGNGLMHGINEISYSTTPALNPLKGVVQQFACTSAGASISPTITGLEAGVTFTVIFVQNGTTACTWSWPTHIYGGMTVSATLSSINVQQFIVSNNGTDAYAISAGSTGVTGGTP